MMKCIRHLCERSEFRIQYEVAADHIPHRYGGNWKRLERLRIVLTDLISNAICMSLQMLTRSDEQDCCQNRVEALILKS